MTSNKMAAQDFTKSQHKILSNTIRFLAVCDDGYIVLYVVHEVVVTDSLSP